MLYSNLCQSKNITCPRYGLCLDRHDCLLALTPQLKNLNTIHYLLLADFQRTAHVLKRQYQLRSSPASTRHPKIQLAHKIANLLSHKLNSSAAHKLQRLTFKCVYIKSPKGAIPSPPLCGPPHHTEWQRHDAYTTSKYQAQKIANPLACEFNSSAAHKVQRTRGLSSLSPP